jgi:hypothetical protein
MEEEKSFTYLSRCSLPFHEITEQSRLQSFMKPTAAAAMAANTYDSLSTVNRRQHICGNFRGSQDKINRRVFVSINRMRAGQFILRVKQKKKSKLKLSL